MGCSQPRPGGDAKKRTPADNATVRNVYVIGPDKKIKLILVYPMTTGRNFDEVLRVIDSLQLTARHQVATPVNWKPGEDVIIAGSISEEEAKRRYPQRLEGAEAIYADRAPAAIRRGRDAIFGTDSVLDPMFDRLRNDPRFDKIVASLAPK